MFVASKRPPRGGPAPQEGVGSSCPWCACVQFERALKFSGPPKEAYPDACLQVILQGIGDKLLCFHMMFVSMMDCRLWRQPFVRKMYKSRAFPSTRDIRFLLLTQGHPRKAHTTALYHYVALFDYPRRRQHGPRRGAVCVAIVLPCSPSPGRHVGCYRLSGVLRLDHPLRLAGMQRRRRRAQHVLHVLHPALWRGLPYLPAVPCRLHRRRNRGGARVGRYEPRKCVVYPRRQRRERGPDCH